MGFVAPKSDLLFCFAIGFELEEIDGILRYICV